MFALSNTRVLTGRAILTSPRRVVAIAALASCASLSAFAASPAPTESARSSVDPAALAAELNAELHLVYRDNVPEYSQRSEQVRHALDAWNASAKSAAERDQIIAWLRESIRLSMPGSAKPLPPLPEPVHEPVAPVHDTTAHDTIPAEPTTKSVLTAKPVAAEPRPAAEARTAPEVKSTSVLKSVSEPPAANPTLPTDMLEDNPFRDDPEFPR